MHYAIRFREELALLSNNPDDYVNEWRYAGGERNSHYNWFKIRYPNTSLPIYQDECICSKDIEENCYIENIIDGRFVVVGNCCIKRFLPKEKSGRTCLDCNKPHRNRKNPWCNDCRGGKIFFGKYEGRFFREVFEEDLEYCQNVLDEPGQYDFKDFLKVRGMKPSPTSKLSIMTIGKHKGKSFESIFKGDKSYVKWVLSLENTQGEMQKFRDWCLTETQ